MTRAGFVAIAALLIAGAGCRQKEVDELKTRNVELEKQRAELQEQVASLARKVQALEHPTAAAGDGTAEEQLQRAQDAYVHGDYKLAIELATKQVDGNPGRAWRVIGASQCFLKDKANAVAASAHLDGPGKNFIKYVCHRSGIEL